MTEVYKPPPHHTNTITTVKDSRAEGLLDLSRSSWLMAAARIANLLVGEPTCSMNEDVLQIHVLALICLQKELHWHCTHLLFLRMDALS